MTTQNILFFVLIAIIITTTACQSDTNSNDATATETVENTQAATDANQKGGVEILSEFYGARASYDFRMGLDSLIGFYHNIAVGLADNNLQASKNNIIPFTESMRSIPNVGVNKEGQSILDANRTALIKHINGILMAKDVNTARVSFYEFSNAMVNLVKAFGTNNENVYLMHSKEAFNNSGAYWLALTDRIRNPYSDGEKIYEGEVVEVFSAK